MNNKRRYIIKRISSYMPYTKTLFAANIVIRLLLTAIILFNPYIFSKTMDSIVNGTYKKVLPYLVLLMLGSFLCETILKYFDIKIDNHLIFSIQEKLRSSIWKRIYSSDYSQTKNLDIGEIKNTISNDVDVFEKTIRDDMIGYLFNVFILIASSVWLLLISARLTILLIIMIPIVYLITKRIGLKVNKTSEQLRAVNGKYEGIIYNSIHIWKSIKVLSLRKLLSDRIELQWKNVTKIQFSIFIYNFLSFLIESIKDLYVVKITVYIVSALLIKQNKMTIGTFILFTNYFGLFINALNAIIASEISIKQNSPSISRVLGYQKGKDCIKKEADIKADKYALQNVSYRYDENMPYILADSNIVFQKNEKILLKGSNGSGKSTLIKLLLGMIEPTKGRVEISGIPICEIDRHWKQNNLAVILQETYLPNMTIYNNMLLANPNASMVEIENACKAACIHDLIVGLKDGYRSIVGENGCLFSGGERQRLLLAQLFLRNPKIIILDEATCSLDKDTETIINQNIDEKFANCMIIRITHNSYQNHKTDRIVSIVDGRLKEIKGICDISSYPLMEGT